MKRRKTLLPPREKVEEKVREREKLFESLLTTADLCRMFGVKEITIYRWRKEHGLPSVTIPGEKAHAVRYVPSEVWEWAEKTGKQPQVFEK